MEKALIIDDSVITREILAKLLRSWGIVSVQAENGHSGLNILQSEPDITIALVDWYMPVMSGIEFVRHIREGRFHDLKVLMITSETEMPGVNEALEAGVDEYLMKPITKEILLGKLALLGYRELEAS